MAGRWHRKSPLSSAEPVHDQAIGSAPILPPRLTARRRIRPLRLDQASRCPGGQVPPSDRRLRIAGSRVEQFVRRPQRPEAAVKQDVVADLETASEHEGQGRQACHAEQWGRDER